MIADDVARRGNAPNECRLCLRKAADHKERGVDIVFGKDVEESRCPRGIRAVIEGECQFVGPTRSDQRTPEDLRGWPHGRVGTSAERKPRGAYGPDPGVNSRY
jgi:hypothetical protein